MRSNSAGPKHCIYDGWQSEDLSREHIVPCALGGKVRRKLCRGKYNGSESSAEACFKAYEKSLRELFENDRIYLPMKVARGTSPGPKVRVPSSTNPAVGMYIYRGRWSRDESSIEYLKKYKNGGDSNTGHSFEYNPPDKTLNEDTFIAMAKIACNAFCYVYPEKKPTVFPSDTTKMIKAHDFSSVVMQPLIVDFRGKLNHLNGFGVLDFFHNIWFYSKADQVYAIVRLFNSYPLRVRVGKGKIVPRLFLSSYLDLSDIADHPIMLEASLTIEDLIAIHKTNMRVGKRGSLGLDSERMAILEAMERSLPARQSEVQEWARQYGPIITRRFHSALAKNPSYS